MTSIFYHYDKPSLRAYLQHAAEFKKFDQAEAYNLALAAMRYYRGDASQRGVLRSGQALEVRWYASLAAGEPDYSVYDDEFFVSDIWACWVVYSRKYLRHLISPSTRHKLTGEYLQAPLVDSFEGVSSVADLGCGIGYTTAGLKELFPQADVYGTQVEGFQFKVAEALGSERGFAVVPEVMRQTDLIFASEYFEHFQKPVDHLAEIIYVAEPKYLILASSFGAKSIGHFDEYYVGSVMVPNYLIGRIFNQTLRENGYAQVSTSLWNNRPAVFKKEEQR